MEDFFVPLLEKVLKKKGESFKKYVHSFSYCCIRMLGSLIPAVSSAFAPGLLFIYDLN